MPYQRTALQKRSRKSSKTRTKEHGESQTFTVEAGTVQQIWRVILWDPMILDWKKNEEAQRKNPETCLAVIFKNIWSEILLTDSNKFWYLCNMSFFSDADSRATLNTTTFKVPDIYCSVDPLYLLFTESSLLQTSQLIQLTPNISANKLKWSLTPTVLESISTRHIRIVHCYELHNWFKITRNLFTLGRLQPWWRPKSPTSTVLELIPSFIVRIARCCGNHHGFKWT